MDSERYSLRSGLRPLLLVPEGVFNKQYLLIWKTEVISIRNNVSFATTNYKGGRK